ncbi:hypothetical protein [Herminiimonas contaminans]|uniref:YdaS antitoxin of YdaST toxin-antitoxin system n=1 Tax=Herminiimonas contaminans TaxID=1111140 RepID=A0ABS0EQV0_9BURK|nr:hypothetical protein [Herminiimonas contaminans]MBF8177234.1 hypothetical protein [Herminiimonas contaminans]
MSEILTTNQKRRDWFKIIRVDLINAGVSMAKVASACGRDPKTIEHWTIDGEPKDSDARVVLALYQKFCPQKYVEHMKSHDANYTPPEHIFARPPAPPVKKREQPKTQTNDMQHELFQGLKT